MDIEVHSTCGGTTRNGHRGPFNVWWDRMGPPEMDIEIQLIWSGTARNGHWGPFNMRWHCQIWTLRSIEYAGTANYRHWGPTICGWNHQIWTLMSNFGLWESNLRALRSKIWTRKMQKSVLRSKTSTFQGCSNTEMTSENILEHPWVIPAWFLKTLTLMSRKID